MELTPRFSHFYLDGELAFMDGAALDENPYEPGEAAAAWRAGWLAASYAAVSLGSPSQPGPFPG